jgi:hypothetical protein
LQLVKKERLHGLKRERPEAGDGCVNFTTKKKGPNIFVGPCGFGEQQR